MSARTRSVPAGVTTAPDTDEVPGYVDLKLLVPGTGSTTYLARRDGADGQVAIKVLGREYGGAQHRKAMNRHWLAAQKLSGHDYILDVLDCGTTYAGQPYIATRYCERGSLGDRLDAGDALAVVDVLNAVVPIALALHAAHRLGLVHCGVKPNNLLLADDAHPYLSDLVGSALRSGNDATAAGAARYWAPELLAGGPNTASSDVYSLTATLFHLLQGRPPHDDSGGIAALLVSMANQPPPIITRPDVPDSVREAVLGALAAEPTDRPDALTLATRLHRAWFELGCDPAYPDAIWPEDPPARTDPPPGPAITPVPRAAPSPPQSPRPVSVTEPAPMPNRAPAPPPQPAQGPLAQPAPVPLARPAQLARPGPAPLHRRVAAPPVPQQAMPVPRRMPDRRKTAELPMVDSRRSRRKARRHVRLRLGLAAALVMIGLGTAAVIRLPGLTVVDAPTHAAPTGSVTVPTGTATPRPRSTPDNVRAIDEGTTVILSWTLQPDEASANVVIQQSPALPGQAPLVVLDPGRTSYPMTGLDPTTAYCFRVGILVSIGVGQPGTVSWADPVAVRGVCSVVGPSPS